MFAPGQIDTVLDDPRFWADEGDRGRRRRRRGCADSDRCSGSDTSSSSCSTCSSRPCSRDGRCRSEHEFRLEDCCCSGSGCGGFGRVGQGYRVCGGTGTGSNEGNGVADWGRGWDWHDGGYKHGHVVHGSGRSKDEKKKKKKKQGWWDKVYPVKKTGEWGTVEGIVRYPGERNPGHWGYKLPDSFPRDLVPPYVEVEPTRSECGECGDKVKWKHTSKGFLKKLAHDPKEWMAKRRGEWEVARRGVRAPGWGDAAVLPPCPDAPPGGHERVCHECHHQTDCRGAVRCGAGPKGLLGDCEQGEYVPGLGYRHERESYYHDHEEEERATWVSGPRRTDRREREKSSKKVKSGHGNLLRRLLVDLDGEESSENDADESKDADGENNVGENEGSGSDGLVRTVFRKKPENNNKKNTRDRRGDRGKGGRTRMSFNLDNPEVSSPINLDGAEPVAASAFPVGNVSEQPRGPMIPRLSGFNVEEERGDKEMVFGERWHGEHEVKLKGE